MAHMDHENIVRLYAVCMSNKVMLISQFVPKGVLLSFLKRNKAELTASMMLCFATQILRVRLVKSDINLSFRTKSIKLL